MRKRYSAEFKAKVALEAIRGDLTLAELAATHVEHDGRRLLRRGTGGGTGPVRLARFGTPEVFNTDQGSQFTSQAFTSVLREAEVRISMDGLGRWIIYYNIQRPHSGLGGRTPVEAYRRIGQSDHGGHNDNRD